MKRSKPLRRSRLKRQGKRARANDPVWIAAREEALRRRLVPCVIALENIPPGETGMARPVDRYRCDRCLRLFELERVHVHHRLPTSRGGTHEQENLACLDRRCHDEVHRRVDPWRPWIVTTKPEEPRADPS